MRRSNRTFLWQRTGALVLLLTLPLPSFGESIRESAKLAAQAPPSTTKRGPMSPGLKWSGLSLLAGGAGLLAWGVAKDNGCFDEEFAGIAITDQDCKDQALGLKVLGGLVAGTGGGLLLLGALERDRLPSVTMTRTGGVAVSQRISF